MSLLLLYLHPKHKKYFVRIIREWYTPLEISWPDLLAGNFQQNRVIFQQFVNIIGTVFITVLLGLDCIETVILVALLL